MGDTARTIAPACDQEPAVATRPDRPRKIGIRRLPPHAYFVGSAIFHYLGPAFAVLLFALVAPLGVAWMRIVSAGLVFALWRRPWRSLWRLDCKTGWLLVGLGGVLAVMNGCFYMAIDRLPLGTVAAIEFLPIILLAALGVRSLRNALALALAVAGVYMLAEVRLEVEPMGLVFAFANAALFALYIVLAHQVARSTAIRSIDGLAAAMLVASVVITPIGGWSATPALLNPMAIGGGIGVGITSSVIPYVFDQLAMERLSRATYSLMVSLLPATATLIGIVVLAQTPSSLEVLGVGLVIAAVAVHRDRREGTEPAPSGHPPESTGPATGRTASGVNLSAAAEAAADRLGIRASDDVLVLCNEPQHTIADALRTVASQRAATARVLSFPTGTRHGEEPPPFVAGAMQRATVIFAVTVFSLSHTRARLEATRLGVRIASMPSLTEEVFARSLPVDYAILERDGGWLATTLTAATSCRIVSSAGTDLRLDLEGRTAIVDDGQLQSAGAFGNLPAGEAYVAPIETSGEGWIVFDGSFAGYGLLRRPLRVKLAAGRIIDVGGEAADWLLRTLDAGGPTGRVIAELGIGVNPGAILTGVVCEDEKVAGTAHLAFGTNVSFGGANLSTVHIDGVLLQPTIELDGRTMMREGRVAVGHGG